MKVYLCGGIQGLSDAEAATWRETTKRLLNVLVLDPLRRDYRGKEAGNAAEIVTNDLADISDCDVLLVNGSQPSWGTAMEIVYAAVGNKAIVVFGAGECPSPWLVYHAKELLPTVEEACDYINNQSGGD